MAANPRQAAYEASKKPTPKPTATKTPAKPKMNPERLLREYLKQGMSLDKARKKVTAETGVWPNGYTN